MTAIVSMALTSTLLAQSQSQTEPAELVIDATPGHEINSFDPDQALGSSIDVLTRRDIDLVYTPHIIEESLSAAWGPMTYRNNSELRMAAWHWNENGAWSDLEHKRGYFTGSSELGAPIRYILEYALPHRGFSTSGDRPVTGPNLSYWKSNPYLTSKFTGETDRLHPQWVVVDLKSSRPVNAIHIGWENPYAKAYEVQYWIGERALDFDGGPDGKWETFPSGAVKNAAGGPAAIVLVPQPVTTRYIRIWMTESSNTCDLHGPGDIRNCVGYAIQDIRPGTSTNGRDFTEVPSVEPTYMSSSIDPWHSAGDVNPRSQHTGFDLFYTSGLTNHLPALIPVTLLYGTPDDAAAQITYLEKRGYPISGIEMGEEPDGKHALPEDYAALYLQWATAIHKVDPKLKLGGPIFEGVNQDIRVWPDAKGRTSWMGRFVDYVREHGRLADLAFVSFEHYPFEPCELTWKTLYKEPELMKHILEVWRADGVPRSVPLIVSESHLAAQLTGPMSTIFAGLWLADNVGSFFEGGGSAFYHSPIQPQPVERSCLGPATWSNFVADRDYNITGYTSLYFAAHMINLQWVAHRSGVHQMYRSSVDIQDPEGNQLVTSYAVHRPDGNWSVMLVNRDEEHAHSIRVTFNNANDNERLSFAGPVELTTFGSEQYVWHDNGAQSYADPDGPPIGHSVAGRAGATYTLPKASITVLRGRIANGK